MPLNFLAHLADNSDRFTRALATVDPQARVPSCPDWTAADLLWHLTEVQLFWGAVVAGRRREPDAAEAAVPARADSFDGLFAQFAQASADLLVALTEAAPSEAVWTWSPDQSVGFVRRRQAHEALIHRIDAELVVGTRTPIEKDLAADGIDEHLRFMFSLPPWADVAKLGPIGRIGSTDTGHEWSIAVAGFSGTSPRSGTSYDGEHCLVFAGDTETPDYRIRGAAADLDTWLWNRPTTGLIELSGDAAAVAAFRTLIGTGVQ